MNDEKATLISLKEVGGPVIMAVITISIGILIISPGNVASGYVPFVFFPKGESNWIIAEISYPLETPFKITEKTVSPHPSI